MSHYLIANIEIFDREEYRKYEEGFMEIFSKYNGKFLSVDENLKQLEGESPTTRIVLIEFPTEQDAMDWYASEEYQELAKHRFAASTASVALIQGLD